MRSKFSRETEKRLLSTKLVAESLLVDFYYGFLSYDATAVAAFIRENTANQNNFATVTDDLEIVVVLSEMK